MHRFDIQYDDKGNPVWVHENLGYMQTSRAFDQDSDGWMLGQLDPKDYPAIQAGLDMLDLVREVNRLRKELFLERSHSDSYRKAVGFGNDV